MKIDPLKGVEGISFGSRAADVIGKFGEPERRSVSRKGWAELHYSSMVCRFQTDSLVEITVDAASIEIDANKISFKNLGTYLKQHDPGTFERVGITVSPALGLAFDPHFSSWVTAFPVELVASWQRV